MRARSLRECAISQPPKVQRLASGITTTLLRQSTAQGQARKIRSNTPQPLSGLRFDFLHMLTQGSFFVATRGLYDETPLVFLTWIRLHDAEGQSIKITLLRQMRFLLRQKHFGGRVGGRGNTTEPQVRKIRD